MRRHKRNSSQAVGSQLPLEMHGIPYITATPTLCVRSDISS